MSTALELLYEYRHLMGKCRSGAGLDMDEIQTVDAIEALFGQAPSSEDARGLTTVVRSSKGKLCDEVHLDAILLDRVVLKGCPWVEAPVALEVIIEDPELRLSYRFKGVVAWTREEGEGLLTVGVELCGVPVLVRRGPRSERSATQAPPASARRRARIVRVAA
jgi:hypothetical protein